MGIPETYYAVFYDNAKPKTFAHAMYKRISESKWVNLLDGIMPKEVELKDQDGKKTYKYRITSHCTFQVFNTVDNNFFGIFYCDKIEETFFEPTVINNINHK